MKNLYVTRIALAGFTIAAIGFYFTLQAATPVNLDVVNPTSSALTDATITFGHVFAPGDIPAGKLVGVNLQGGGTIAAQTDAKATWADGSLRHAVMTIRLAALPAGATQRVILSPVAPIPVTSPISLSDLLASTYDVSVAISIGSTVYSISAKALLTALQTGGSPQQWLSGSLASEWIVNGSPKTPGGEAHPHLNVSFHVRAYAGTTSVRTDVVVENDWAFEPNPQGYTYDVTINSAGTQVYSKKGIRHTHHTRWHKQIWWGVEQKADVKYDIDYLFATKAVPNYDRRIVIAQSAISSLKTGYEPMSCGDLTSYMPETGAHDDIGPLPRFAALYLMTMDLNAKANVLANGGCGGSYQIHYRDKSKNMPVTLDDYPFMTILGNPGDTYNPKTGKYESFPTVVNGLDTLTPDDAHQPSIAYLPYLISGDYFFLEELLFWTNWNLLYTNPGYRDGVKGLFKSLQERGQAWDMRTLGQAAFITPDNHPQKAGLIDKLNNNISYYTAKYADTVKTNRLGYLDDGYSLAYAPYGIAPWQDDFFTYSIGSLVDLGFTQAKNFLLFKSRFVVGRMTDPEFCWLHATAYSLQVGKSASEKYQSFGEMYRANFSDTTSCKGLVMDGYPDSPTSYGSNMQPGLAEAVDCGAPGAAAAWTKYETRYPRQNYTSDPEWAVVPRDKNSAIKPLSLSQKSTQQSLTTLSKRLGRTGVVILYSTGTKTRKFDLRGRLIEQEKMIPNRQRNDLFQPKAAK